MNELRKSEGSVGQKSPEATLLDRLPAAAKKFLVATGQSDWPKLRLILCGCEPAGDLIELASEMNRAMQICPPIISTREWKGQLARGPRRKGLLGCYFSGDVGHFALSFRLFPPPLPSDQPLSNAISRVTS